MIALLLGGYSAAFAVAGIAPFAVAAAVYVIVRRIRGRAR